MGIIHAEIELINADDLAYERRGDINPNEVRRETVTALVDTGAYMLSINQHIQNQLGLPDVKIQEFELANGQVESYPIVGPVILNFENRTTSCNAVVLPGDSEVLLGSIPMEDLDVVLNPKEQRMEVNPANPYMARKLLK